MLPKIPQERRSEFQYLQQKQNNLKSAYEVRVSNVRPSGLLHPAKLCYAARGHIFNLRVCYKITHSFKRLGIPPSVIFTRAAQNQPTITVMSIGVKNVWTPLLSSKTCNSSSGRVV